MERSDGTSCLGAVCACDAGGAPGATGADECTVATSDFSILIIEDNPGDARLVTEHLREAGLATRLRATDTLTGGIAALRKEPADVALVDLGLPDSAGPDTVRKLTEAFPETAVVALTGLDDIGVATEVIHQGAMDYLVKHAVTPELLERSIRFCVERHRMGRTIAQQVRTISEGQQSLAAVFESAPVPMLFLNDDLDITAVNSAASTEFDASHQPTTNTVIGEALRCLNSVNDAGGCGHVAACDSCALRATVVAVRDDSRRRSAVRCSIPIESDSGDHKDLLVSAARVRGDEGDRILVCLEDMTDRFAAERRVERLNRLLRTAYEIGLVTRREKEPVNLLRESCRIVVANGGYVAAWVARMAPVEKHLTVVTAYGIDGNHWQPGQSPCQGDDHPCGAPAQAIEHGRPTIQLGEAALAWEERTGHQIRGIGAFPLQLTDGSAAVLSVASLSEDAFDPDTVQLLEEVAGDLSKSLETLGIEAERERFEAELRASEERHRMLVERNVAGVFRTRTDGEIVLANDAMARIFGYRHVSQLLEVNDSDLYADPRDRRRLITEYLAHGEVRNFEVEMVTCTGARAWVLINAVLIPDATGVDSFIEGTMLDITDTRSMADQLHHAQRMEAVGRLAGGVAHEFNNLLQAMSSTVEGLIARSADIAGDECSGLRDVSHLIERGSQVARQLLVFSRRETSKLAPVAIEDMISDVARLLRRLLRESIEIEVSSADETLVVEADRGQLEQVLVNLALNSQDAMPDGGHLVLSADRHHDMVCLRVHDSGAGIPAEYRDRIFEPFFTTKGSRSGTGLGLSVVHGIVTRFGGSIEVESHLGRGTTFTILFPESLETIETEHSPEQPAISPSRGEGQTILVVEDEEAVRDGLTSILEILGYRFVECSDITDVDQEKIELADLVLSDLVLPGGSGLDLCRRIRSSHPDLPMVLMSGYSVDATEAARIHDIVFLQKPFTMSQISAALAAQFQGLGNHDT